MREENRAKAKLHVRRTVKFTVGAPYQDNVELITIYD